MKKVIRSSVSPIKAAEEDDTRVTDKINEMKDTFNFLTEGIELIASQSSEDTNVALTMLDELNSHLEDSVAQIGAKLAE